MTADKQNFFFDRLACTPLLMQSHGSVVDAIDALIVSERLSYSDKFESLKTVNHIVTLSFLQRILQISDVRMESVDASSEIN